MTKHDTPVAIVTGGSRGIGAATARLLAAEGWSVAITYAQDRAAAEAVARDVEAAGQSALVVQADTSSEADVARLFAEVDRAFGRLDGLVNNAGMVGPRGMFDELTGDDMWRVLAVNVVGPILCARAAIKVMSTAEGGRGGVIVNVSSGSANQGGPNENVLYATSKGGLNSLTIGLSQEVTGQGIRVNTLAPGLTDTDMPGADKVSRVGPTLPLGRAATADEIAEGIVFLMGDDARYVSGANLRVGGGRP